LISPLIFPPPTPNPQPPHPSFNKEENAEDSLSTTAEDVATAQKHCWVQILARHNKYGLLGSSNVLNDTLDFLGYDTV
jgi:hypothetical protein